jgi:hypothetical protein
MPVDNFARSAERAVPGSTHHETAKERPPSVPMSATAGTLHEPPASPHPHRPYYRSLLKKT